MIKLHRAALKAAKKAGETDDTARDAHRAYRSAVSHCGWKSALDLGGIHQVAEQVAAAAFEEARLAFAALDAAPQTAGPHIECVTLSNDRVAHNVLVPDGPNPVQWFAFYARDRAHAEALLCQIERCGAFCTTYKAVTV